MKQYQSAEIEIIRFDAEDIVTSSTCEFEGEIIWG
jgi:hypothetical protein